MTLASQNIRSESRHRHMTSRRNLVSPRLVGGVLAVAAVTTAAWWLLRDSGGGRGDQPSDSAGPSGAVGVPETVGHEAETDSTQPRPQQGRETGAASKGGTGQRPTEIVMGGHVDLGKERGATSGAQDIDQSKQGMDAQTRSQDDARGSAPSGSTGSAVTRDEAPSGATANEQAPAKTPPADQGPPTKTTTNEPGDAATNAGADRLRSNAGQGGAVGVTTNVDLAEALRLQETDPVRARLLATRAIDSGTMSTAERQRTYELLNSLSQKLFLNPNVNPNDPTVSVYVVQPGDTLQRIVRDQKLACDVRLLQRLNQLADPNRLRIKQRLRVPKGVFHAEVIKNEYRLNLYLGEGSDRVLVQSFLVGLGESNGTPLGLFKVRPDSKLIDPQWTHPRTGQHFASNDPLNPIGEHWLGLVGVEDRNKSFEGYGIHGTIEPDSIGKDRSLGCVRMLPNDIALVYECLTEPDSTVLIR